MRKVAGAIGHESFKANQRIVFDSNNYDPSRSLGQQSMKWKRAYRFLKMYGLEDFSPTGQRPDVSFGSDEALAQLPEYAEAIIRFSNDAIFTPNPNDIPAWAQTPVGGLIAQLKTFPLMISRMGKELVWNDLRLYAHDSPVIPYKAKNIDAVRGTGDPKRALYYMSLGPLAGMGALASKDIIQGRGGEDRRSHALRERSLSKLGFSGPWENSPDIDAALGWYAEGLLLMGGLGILGDLMSTAVQQADNGVFGRSRMIGTLAGPTYGLFMSGMEGLQGASDYVTAGDNGNAKERAGVKALAHRIPIFGQVGSVRETIVDEIAGEKEGRGGKYSSKYSSRYKSKY